MIHPHVWLGMSILQINDQKIKPLQAFPSDASPGNCPGWCTRESGHLNLAELGQAVGLWLGMGRPKRNVKVVGFDDKNRSHSPSSWHVTDGRFPQSNSYDSPRSGGEQAQIKRLRQTKCLTFVTSKRSMARNGSTMQTQKPECSQEKWWHAQQIKLINRGRFPVGMLSGS